MDRPALLQLRDRLAKATGPDRELDVAIAKATGQKMHGDWVVVPSEIEADQEAVEPAPAYTASIDAAVTLVPEGWSRLVATSPTASVVCLSAKGLGEVDGQRWTPTSRAPTEPLALCFARIEYELAKTPEPT